MQLTDESLVEFAKEFGKEGFTSWDVIQRFGCSRLEARAKINRQLCHGTIRWTGKKISIPLMKNPRSLYVASGKQVSSKPKIDRSNGHANVMAAIRDLGHDEDYEPKDRNFICTGLPGSEERIEAYAKAVEEGRSIFSDDDVKDGPILQGEIPDSGERCHGSPREYSLSVSKRGSVATRCT
jgi:hypothetical protein